MSPEQALWLEVILRAFQDLVDVDRSSARARWQREALDWIFSNDDDVGSFLFCCEAINVDAGAVRRGLQSISRNDLKQRLRLRSEFVGRRIDSLDDPLDSTNGRAYSPLRALNW